MPYQDTHASAEGGRGESGRVLTSIFGRSSSPCNFFFFHNGMLWHPKHPNIMPIDRSVGVHCRSNPAVTDNSVARELGRAVPVPRAGNGLQLQREHSRRVRTTPCAPERSPSASRREARGILRVARRMRARHRARFPAARARLLRATACAGCVGAATALLPACRAWRARRCVPAAETSKCGALAGRTWRARRAVQARAPAPPAAVAPGRRTMTQGSSRAAHRHGPSAATSAQKPHRPRRPPAPSSPRRRAACRGPRRTRAAGASRRMRLGRAWAAAGARARRRTRCATTAAASPRRRTCRRSTPRPSCTQRRRRARRRRQRQRQCRGRWMMARPSR